MSVVDETIKITFGWSGIRTQDEKAKQSRALPLKLMYYILEIEGYYFVIQNNLGKSSITVLVCLIAYTQSYVVSFCFFY
jgi:hypothetical protein